MQYVRLFLIFAMTFFSGFLSAQDLDSLQKPDLNDPAVKHGYREGRNDTSRARFSTGGDEDYQYVEDSEFLNDTAYVPPTKNPKLAGWMSFVLPGSGQFYNGQYWKIPVIYGAFGTLIYVSEFYNVRYKQLKNDERYFLAQQQNDTTYTGGTFYGLTNEADIVRYMRKYRRYRDLCYLGTFLVYIMNIFDAVVDAHLYDYNVTDDITLRVEPYAQPEIFGCRSSFGAKFVIKF
jgi:TM2 domain-containing membrane protein YozV